MDFKLPKRLQNSNKSTYGRVLNIAGSDFMPGAAYLSSVSALKVGCGYCFLCSTQLVINSVSAQTQNIVFLPVQKLEENIKLADAIEIGCGLSTNKNAKKLFKTTINTIEKDKPLIIDADGLNILSQNEYKKIFLERQLSKVIMTPHPKEASRLLNCKLEDIISDIKGAAKEISNIYDCITVLKTNNTYIYSPEGKDYTNNTGNSALAKAGSGDVLTGVITGLVTQGMDIFEGACLGVYLHGLCSQIASQDFTQYCVMAKDLIDYIPKSIRQLQGLQSSD